MRHRIGCVGVAIWVLAAAPAVADAIDGDWCFGAANFHIQGSAIRTPAGKDIIGDYSRHAFHYLAPAGETDAGADVMMRLMNEVTVLLTRRVGGVDGATETWMRCQPVS